MGPGNVDMTTFPPTMLSPGAPVPNDYPSPTAHLGGNNTANDSLNILSSGFWDSMLVPGYSTMDGFSGGFVFGAGGSGLITPRIGATPTHSGRNSPAPKGSGQ